MPRTISRTYILAPRGALWLVLWRQQETRQDVLVLGPVSSQKAIGFISDAACKLGQIVDFEQEDGGIRLVIASPAWRHHHHKEATT